LIGKTNTVKKESVDSTPKSQTKSETATGSNKNDFAQRETKTNNAKRSTVRSLPIFIGFVAGALVGGIASPVFFTDTANLKEQNSQLEDRISALQSNQEGEFKELQGKHDAEISAMENQLAQQKSVATDNSNALVNAKAAMDKKDSEISVLKEQLAELKAQGQDTSKTKPGNTYPDILPGLRMVSIPAGKFLMGSPETEAGRGSDEGPQRKVAVQAFELSDTEVTFEQYDIFANETQRELPDDEGWGRGDRPVIHVSWNDAIAYINWLNGKTTSNFRLPSEAEWEYAARAGTRTPFYTGNCISAKQANYQSTVDYNECGVNTGKGLSSTSAVKSYEANDWGLYDMASNVRELTQDCWHENYTNAPSDGSVWLENNGGNCDRRVLRGGWWFGRPELLRSANRDWNNLVLADSNVGFRLARTP